MTTVADSSADVPHGALAPKKETREALCNLLDRMGGDGVVPFVSGDSPEKVADEIYNFVQWLQERAREEGRGEGLAQRDGAAHALRVGLQDALAILDLYNIVGDNDTAIKHIAGIRALLPVDAQPIELAPTNPIRC